ncbi:MAG TPA: hypothetical protein PK293_09885 [Spirochaetota bacterium]|nr:hypothetical protein [Spirochaetota bacterium]HPF06333.1 hypothetical protein [Spirochaetota bacterium]HPJ43060.1 hypothetical protein [Spirochaetota bacterium]HPR36728.1 hypothetical protein [Spirochaetota bacterium]
MPGRERYYIRELEEKFFRIKMNYYRFVIRNEDKNVLSKFAKIPESWDDYRLAEGLLINEDVKNRLSDIKKRKSWELKLESLYLFYITDVENKLISVMQQRDISENEIDEAIDSVNNLIIEFDDELINFKYLMLTLAKRSISDFYYILSAYNRFFFKKNFLFERDVKTIMNDFIPILTKYKNRKKLFSRFLRSNEEIEPLFPKSSNQLGWRMNEFAVKEYLDKSNQAVKMAELNWTVKEGFEYKKILMNYYSFLKYYYNDNDGKMFRLNFISDSLKVKLDEGKISREIYDSYEEIKEAFREYKLHFEGAGLLEFGPDEMSYIELLDFIYRVSKIIEFYHLRNMKHEQLQVFRNQYFYYIEKEIFSIKG